MDKKTEGQNEIQRKTPFSNRKWSSCNYIGSHNAETVLRKAEEMKVDKKRLKFRETGILDIYLK